MVGTNNLGTVEPALALLAFMSFVPSLKGMVEMRKIVVLEF